MPGINTTAIHGGDMHNATHAHVTPIYQNSTYTYDSIAHSQAVWHGEQKGYIYGRLSNPNTESTARQVAALESHGLDFEASGMMVGSGMAAISTVMLAQLNAGDVLVAQHSVYGGTGILFHSKLPTIGIQTEFFDGHDLESLDKALDACKGKNIGVIYIESPANPTIALTDIAAVAERAKAVGAMLVVDNTFATPILQQPFVLGADTIIHSTTKYLTGHGTVVGGTIVTKDEEFYNDRLAMTMPIYGFNAGPMDAWLTYNGIKTLPLRMQRHCENGQKVAEFLSDHPLVETVYYPGLSDFPQHDLAKKQMKGFGGMISFELKGGFDAGVAVMNNVKLWTLAVSLGAVDSLIQHPASMTHSKNAPEVREAMGVTDGLTRLSVGLEDVEDLIDDLAQALAKIKR